MQRIPLAIGSNFLLDDKPLLKVLIALQLFDSRPGSLDTHRRSTVPEAANMRLPVLGIV